MIDKFTILLPHALMILMALRLITRRDLDRDPLVEAERRPMGKVRKS